MASASSAREFVGFPITPNQHVVIGCSYGSAFDVDDANGSPVTEVLAKDSRTYLHMVPDDNKTRTLAEQWSIPSNIKELRVPVFAANALSTLDQQSWKMENKITQTNSLLGKALIPLIRFMDKHANSHIPTIVDAFEDISDSLCMLLPVFNYLNLMRDLITDKF